MENLIPNMPGVTRSSVDAIHCTQGIVSSLLGSIPSMIEVSHTSGQRVFHPFQKGAHAGRQHGSKGRCGSLVWADVQTRLVHLSHSQDPSQVHSRATGARL
uniref:Uncharacterized protein n=1 Tax=Eutreptiella gymnastica TaxID=73025 RepID=A0A7S1J598_9EUGL